MTQSTDSNNMLLHSLTPMLRTWDVPGTLGFCAGTLGFACAFGI
jgi:hypothetical protein